MDVEVCVVSYSFTPSYLTLCDINDLREQAAPHFGVPKASAEELTNVQFETRLTSATPA